MAGAPFNENLLRAGHTAACVVGPSNLILAVTSRVSPVTRSAGEEPPGGW